MTIDAAIGDPARWSFGAVTKTKRHWPALIGFAVMATVTIVSLASKIWGTELGSHGPIVLAAGVWLLWRLDLEDSRGAMDGAVVRLAPLFALPVLAAYVFGRAYDYISIEAGAAYLTFLLLAWMLLGGRQLAANLFPFLYLGFLVPPPGWMIDRATAPLQIFVSKSVTELLQLLHFPIEEFGVTIYIAQYQLLVEQACSGMNSIVGLAAVSMLYIYIIHGTSWRYMAFLASIILPIAVLTNSLRVLALVLITYYFGDAAAQGFLHETTGLALFAVALLLIFTVDLGVQHWILRAKRA